MKHLVRAAVIAIILVSCCLTTFASETGYETFEYGISSVDVIFNQGTPFSDAQQEMIVSYLSGVRASPAVTENLICTLFGHNYVYDTVISITHKVMPTPPRCLQETHLFGICSRCDDMTDQVTSSEFIDCCP